MKLLELEFSKNDQKLIDLESSSNLETINQYILPIIEQNEGWGTGQLTKENFNKTPVNFQNDIDSTLLYEKVFVLLVDGKPEALLVYFKENFAKSEFESTKIVKELLANPNDLKWQECLNLANITQAPGKEEIVTFLLSKPLYYGIGIVLCPKLQGKKSGYSEYLYKQVSDGIVMGYTSNPIILRKRTQTFKHNYLYPLFGEPMDTVDKFAIHLYAYADIIRHKRIQSAGFEFGVMKDDYFVDERGDKYVKIAREMMEKDKLSMSALAKFEYIMQYRQAAGIIVSYN